MTDLLWTSVLKIIKHKDVCTQSITINPTSIVGIMETELIVFPRSLQGSGCETSRLLTGAGWGGGWLGRKALNIDVRVARRNA